MLKVSLMPLMPYLPAIKSLTSPGPLLRQEIAGERLENRKPAAEYQHQACDREQEAAVA